MKVGWAIKSRVDQQLAKLSSTAVLGTRKETSLQEKICCLPENAIDKQWENHKTDAKHFNPIVTARSKMVDESTNHAQLDHVINDRRFQVTHFRGFLLDQLDEIRDVIG